MEEGPGWDVTDYPWRCSKRGCRRPWATLSNWGWPFFKQSLDQMAPAVPPKLRYSVMIWENEQCQTQAYLAEGCVGLPQHLQTSSMYSGGKVGHKLFFLLNITGIKVDLSISRGLAGWIWSNPASWCLVPKVALAPPELEVPTAALDPSAFGALLCFSSNQFHPLLNLLLWLQYPRRQKESLS